MPYKDIIILRSAFFRKWITKLSKSQDENFRGMLKRKDFYVNAHITWQVLSSSSRAWQMWHICMHAVHMADSTFFFVSSFFWLN